MRTPAPSSRHRSNLAADPAVTATSAPSARTIWMAWVPIPLAPPCTKTSSPAASPAVMTRLDHTVQATSGSPAASCRLTPAGSGSTCAAGTATYCAYPPPASRAQTCCPATRPVTPSPTAAMVPDTSRPMMSLVPGGGGYLPAAWSRSARFTPAALTAITTSPAPAETSGTSATTSRPEVSVTIARMRSRYFRSRPGPAARLAGGGVAERPNALALKARVG